MSKRDAQFFLLAPFTFGVLQPLLIEFAKWATPMAEAKPYYPLELIILWICAFYPSIVVTLTVVGLGRTGRAWAIYFPLVWLPLYFIGAGVPIGLWLWAPTYATAIIVVVVLLLGALLWWLNED
ncbi:MAG: hypothetical protein IT567_02300 [Alphaproteobacteria bacterium]|nr:hypothetical protein [Alphaproteobacteria bacterium]